jgi:Polyketide synthase dehydratase N-terminal domain
MSAPERPLATTLHRTWPFECVVLRAASPERLAPALLEAADRLASDAETPLAVAARQLCDLHVSGRLTAAFVADGREVLATRLRQAGAQIASGVLRIDADGAHYVRDPCDEAAGAIWLFEGAHAVRPGLCRDLALWLPGIVEAFDQAAAADADPGGVADFLSGPGDAGALPATTRARLALAAGGGLGRWLLRVLQPPARAIGGPGAGGPWMDTRAFEAGRLATCDLDAVAAVPDADWVEVLNALRPEPYSVLLHVGPGPAPDEPAGIVGLHSDAGDGLRAFLDGLARLAAAGLPVDLAPLFDLRGVPHHAPARTPGTASRTFVFQPRSPRFDPRVVTLPERAARPVMTAPPAAAGPTAPGDDRADIVLQHLETMRLFLDQHQAAVRLLYGGAAADVAAPPVPARSVATPAADPGPMLHQILSLAPGERLTAAARYDVNEALFLRQHTPNVSAVSSVDPRAFGLPVMPLTFSMETLAEAAALLAPDRVVTGFERLDAQHWMTFERGAVDVRVTAEVMTRGDRLEVAAAVLDPADPRRVYLSGRVILEHDYPAAPVAPEFSDRAAVACNWTADAIYPRRGFHGPLLRAITRVGRHGDAGMTGEITVLPRAPLFASAPRPAFRIDPVLLDALGMGVGIWTWREEMNGVYPVPFRIGRVRLYGPPLPEGETLAMHVAITRNRDGLIAADLYAARADGHLHAEAGDWEDYVYRLPLAVHRIARDPFGQRIAATVTLPASTGWGDVALVELPQLPPGLLTAAEGIWEKILAFYWLAPAERQEWARLDGDPGRRLAWLMGRAAVKDAARAHLAARGRLVGAFDLPMRATPDGRPMAEGLSLALAVDGEGVWAAAADSGVGALGLEVLTPGRIDEAAVANALGSGDRQLLRAFGGDGPLWGLCAKRAAAAAIRPATGLDLRALPIVDADTATGALRMRPREGWISACGGLEPIEALTVRRGDRWLALARVASLRVSGLACA